MNKRVFNIEPFIFEPEELSFSEFFENKKTNPRYYHNSLENSLKTILNTDKEVCTLSSGTAAIHMALLLSGIEKGDVVFCASATFVASVNPILYCGATPYFVDIDLETGNMSAQYLEEAIQECIENKSKPKAIIVTHSYGYPANMNALMHLKEKYGLLLIEDAAEALGSRYENNSCGTIGDYGILSFNSNKLATTMGGGALLVNSKEEKSKVKSLSSHSRNQGSEYIHESLGYNYVMNNLAAFLGCHQLRFLDKELQRKQEIFQWYSKLMDPISGVELIFNDKNDEILPNRWMNCIAVEQPEKKTEIQNQLSKHGVEARGFWYPMQAQKFLQKYPYKGNSESLYVYERVLCLPSGIKMKKEDVVQIVELIHKIVS